LSRIENRGQHRYPKMGFHQIARISFEAEIKTHPQVIVEEFDFKAPNWFKGWLKYIKEDGLSRYTLQKVSKKLFVLTIEQLDLFGMDLGLWDENSNPERENIIKETLQDIEKEFGTKLSIVDIVRVVC
jgi:hypothetical protein